MLVAKMKKKTVIIPPFTMFLVSVAACGEGGGVVDCRHKSMECAQGFVCAQGETGRWECAKPEPAAAPREEEIRPEPARAPAGGEAATRPCPDHPRCAKLAIECLCDAKGELVSQTLDRDRDGKGDEKARFQYNQEGFLTFVIVDEGMDGKDDLRHEYGYRGEGAPLFWEIRKTPGSANTKPDSRLSYIYDEAGSLVSESLDLGIDGKAERRCLYDPPCAPPIPNPACKAACEDVEIAPARGEER